ncbi:hypothetical protein H6L86_03895 [Staphylococcus epidermidis]|nr:hypothetical protein [Staphylococcus epidermidis]
MEFKYMAIPSIAMTLLLTGCVQKDNDHDEASKNKQEQKKKDSKKVYTENNQNSNTEGFKKNSASHKETQAEANQRMQEESRSEHNGMSNAEYATKINEEANSGKEYQEYLGAKESQHAITHLTPEQKANGAGGGGAGWNYAEEDESFSEWKDRRDREKTEAGY